MTDEKNSTKTLVDALNSIAASEKEKPTKAKEPTQPRRSNSPLKKRLQDSFTGVGMSLAFIDPTCGGVIVQRAEMLAESFDTLARENPAVKRALESFTQSSAWGGVIMAVGGTVMPILAHHDALPKFGGPKKKPLAPVANLSDERNKREDMPQPEGKPAETPPAEQSPSHNFDTPLDHDHPEGYPYHEHAEGKHQGLSENPRLGDI